MISDRKISLECIAVAGLNPHAGENGAFGDEEIRIIRPAIHRSNDLANPSSMLAAIRLACELA